MIRGEEPEPLRRGQHVGEGRYLLGEMLGRGGLASVFAAQDLVEGREVALKVLRVRYVGRPEREERLWRELDYTRRVEHPAIVKVYEGGRLEERRPFFAMERVHGRPLSQVLSGGGRLPIARVVGLGRAMAEALAALHRQGIVHRDVKPANVLVLDGDRIKLLDLGMAGDENAPALPVGHMGRLTRADDLLGTHEYMAPEQVLKASPHWAMDVFALGVVLYEMLAGITPYSGMKVREYVELQVQGDPHIRSAARWARLRGAPAGLADLIDACRLRDPGQRPTVKTVIERLEQAAAQEAAGRALVLVPPRGLVAVLGLRGEPEVVPASVPAPVELTSPVGGARGERGRPGRRVGWRVAAAIVPMLAACIWWATAPTDRSSVDHALAALDAAPHLGSSPTLAVARPAEPPKAHETRVEPRPVAPSSEGLGELVTARSGRSIQRAPASGADDCEQVREDARAAIVRRSWSAALRRVASPRCWPQPAERLRIEVHALAQLQRWDACIAAGRGSSDEIVEDWVLLCNNHAHPNPGGS